jgi:drug/metabolite transporter (DMT)-like permease
VAAAEGVDPRLLLRLLRQPLFVAAVTLNLVGYALHVVALRTLPLFLVQAIIAASVAVTALLSGPVLGTPLDRAGRVAVAGTALGLVVLTLSSGAADEAEVPLAGRWALVGAAAAVAVVGVLAGRFQGRRGAAALGLAAGLGYAVVGIGSRAVPDLSPGALVADPAAYAVVAAGVCAYLLYSTALQRGEVMTATGPMVVAQTVVPALVGLLLLGDGLRSGWEVPAVLGLALALWGAVRLGRGRAATEPASAHLL